MKNVAMSFLPHINYGWRDIARDIGLTWFSATLIAAISAMVMGDWERHLVISNLTGSLAYVLGLMGVRFFQPSLNQLSWLFVGSAAASARSKSSLRRLWPKLIVAGLRKPPHSQSPLSLGLQYLILVMRWRVLKRQRL